MTAVFFRQIPPFLDDLDKTVLNGIDFRDKYWKVQVLKL